MGSIARFLIQLDDGSTVEIPAAPAVTDGMLRALSALDGVLAWRESGSTVGGGYYKPLSNGDSENPAVVFADGSVVMIWVTD